MTLQIPSNHTTILLCAGQVGQGTRLLIALSFILLIFFISDGCYTENEVEQYFEVNRYQFPMHLENVSDSLFLVFNTETGTEYTEEYRGLFNRGVKYIREVADKDWCENLTFKADAYILSNPVVWIDNRNIYYAINIYVISSDSSSWHMTQKVENYSLWRTHNIALFKEVDSEFVFSGWHY